MGKERLFVIDDTTLIGVTSYLCKYQTTKVDQK